MSDFLNGLVEVKNGTKRVSDSLERRKRILDAKRRMAARRENADENADENASSINNRISDSARPAMRGTAKRASAVQGLTRKQDSASKTYRRLRQRIKDEFAETETTEEAIEAAVNVLAEEAENSPEAILEAAENVLSAAVDVIAEILPDDADENVEAPAEEELPAEAEDFEDEVSDSVNRHSIVRRRNVADARRHAMITRRVKDAMARRRAVASRRHAVSDATASRARAIAAARRIRDARMRRRAADSRMNRPISRRG